MSTWKNFYNFAFILDDVQKIKIEYARAEGYPVDLYYLMDLSYSMRDDKENLSRLGKRLAETMRQMTSDFRLGFGSFVDKVTKPFYKFTDKE